MGFWRNVPALKVFAEPRIKMGEHQEQESGQDAAKILANIILNLK